MQERPLPSETGAQSTRRALLKAAGAASAAGAFSAIFSEGAAASTVAPEDKTDTGVFEISRNPAESVFPQSVASGGPTTSGAILWTRIAPAAYEQDASLGVEVANDEQFSDVVYRGQVPASEITPEHDYTVNVDLDEKLGANAHYFYRFVYDGDASRVGRCRTLPEPDASPDRLDLAVVSCNNYMHGYFGGFAHVADEDVDFLVHLGDFIYEYSGDGNQPGRDVRLPSGKDVVHGLSDFRHIYRTYREDEFLQRALERHTIVHTWDDHEVINNRWWNYEEDAPETESHPRGGDPQFMRQLTAEGIAAYTEYVPARVAYDPNAETLHEQFRLYRSIQFGDLAELFMTDERLYRSPPPEDAFSRRDTGVPPSEEADDPDRTMLGREQRQWFTDGVAESDSKWTLWGNEVLTSPLKYANAGELSMYLNYDAWDGYRHERQSIMGTFAQADVDNLITLTGDMHTYVAAYILTDHESAKQTAQLPAPEDRVGVEFMAPGVTSDNLGAIAGLPADQTEDAIDLAIQSQNPHIEWFNSSRWGYTVVSLTRDECYYTAYSVDRTVDSADAPKQLLRTYRVPDGKVELEAYQSATLDALVGDVVDSTTESADGPDVYTHSDGSGDHV